MKLKKTMTHDMDTERSILKEILVRNSVLGTVLKLELKADDFSDDNHRVIFQAYCKLSENRAPINMETVTAQLQSLKQSEHVNYSNTLSLLFTNGFSIGNVSAYVQILKSHAVLRRMTGNGT